MASEEELFANIDALLEEEPQLPPPAERARLREAAGITQTRLAQALELKSAQSIKNWENGRSEPKSPRLDAYQGLLNGWAAKYPAPGAVSAAAPVPTAVAAPGASELETTDAPQPVDVPGAGAARPATPGRRGIAASGH